MTDMPEVSVVMGVRNVAGSLRATLESLLAQEGVALEVLVVDDGSTDATWDVLADEAARDARVCPLRQEAQGLTFALARGCAAARAPVIARQDGGPRSRALPGRLRRGLQTLESRPDAALVSCGARYLTLDGLLIEELVTSAVDAAEGLGRLDVRRVRGVAHHGGTMFRASQYRAVGGYRTEFRLAQDLDLWLRLAEQGCHVALPDILVEGARSPDSTSLTQRGLQLRFAALAIEAARRRRAGEPEGPVLAQAQALSARPLPLPGRRARAAAHYALGAQLRRRHPASARQHFGTAVALAPWHLKAWMRWLTTRSPS